MTNFIKLEGQFPHPLGVGFVDIFFINTCNIVTIHNVNGAYELHTNENYDSKFVCTINENNNNTISELLNSNKNKEE